MDTVKMEEGECQQRGDNPGDTQGGPEEAIWCYLSL